jgi:hypothetical protein
MSVYKRHNVKRVSSSHPDYSAARWWIYKTAEGKVIHQSVPEAKTKQEAELADKGKSEPLKYWNKPNLTRNSLVERLFILISGFINRPFTVKAPIEFAAATLV